MARPIVNIFITVQDAPGSESVIKINLPSNSEIATAKTFARNTMVFIDALIKGKITSASIGIGVDISGLSLKTAADALSDVEEGARFIFAAANGGSTTMRLPTFDEAKMVSGTDLVDTADTDVSDFVDQIVNGQTISLQAQHPSAADESDITALTSARSAFQAERKA